MKTKLKSIVYFLLVIIFYSSIISHAADIVKQQSGSLTTRVKKIIYPSNPPSYQEEFSYDCGTYIYEGGTKVLYRAIWDFTLPTNLPAGAYAKKVELVYKTSSYDDIIISYVESYPSGQDYEEKWNTANDAIYVYELNGTNGSTVTEIISGLLEYIRDAHEASQAKVYLSFRDESDINAIGLISLSDLALKITYEIRVTITADNNFTDNSGAGTHGSIIVGSGTETAPFEFKKVIGESATLAAVSSQTDNEGYQRIWHTGEVKKSEWHRNNQFAWYDQAYTFTVSEDDAASVYQANLQKVYNLTFSNSFNGISTTGSIKVDGSTVTAPTAQYPVVDGNTIQVEAIPQTYNDIKYTFSHWSDNNSTVNPRTITANSHANFTAVYVGTPIFTNFGINNRDLHFNTYNPRIQQFVTLYWNEHVSSNVTSYKIYRSNKSLGETYFIYIGSVSRGTTSYQDADYYLTSSSGGTELKYDVRAYYSPDQTASDGGYVSVRGTSAQINKTANTDSTSTELPAINEYALNSNYPNPFNPTTQISYQLPENSFVNLVVYNSLGQKVEELVNQNQSSGKYTVKFNAANLPSGVYIYKLQTDNFSDVKKMLLTK